MDEASESLQALPSEWVRQIFRRFRVIYGSRLDSMWSGADANDLTQAWAVELAAYEGVDIKAAIEGLRDSNFVEWPPTLFQFADLCREARRRRTQTAIAIAGPRTEMPEAVRVKLREFVAKHT
jgi:hypothetical protein